MSGGTKNRIQVNLKPLDELSKTLNDLANGNEIDEAIERAFIKAHKWITDNARNAMIPHNKTGHTVSTLVEAKVEKGHHTLDIDVGFDIANGGLPSIFLMYGTAKHEPNHPATAPDKRLYNVFYGKGVRAKITRMEKQEVQEAINRRLKNGR